MSISSKVSTQSDAKPGQITNKFFTPFCGNHFRVLAVYGVSHSFGPNLD